MSTIVVGVDGSTGSLDALKWALSEARVRNDEVRAVAVWSFQPVGFGDVFVPPIPVVDQSDSVRAHVEELLSGLDTTGVEITLEVVEGNPASVLLDRSREADLLVVGARGAGGFLGLIMGSVARNVSAHAVCPTVVIPHRAK